MYLFHIWVKETSFYVTARNKTAAFSLTASTLRSMLQQLDGQLSARETFLHDQRSKLSEKEKIISSQRSEIERLEKKSKTLEYKVRLYFLHIALYIQGCKQ